MPIAREQSINEYQLIGPSEDGTISDVLASLGAKEARQRLQALIAEWLRMENLVVLAGAGTSVTSGGKTMVALEREVLTAVRLMPSTPPSVTEIIDARMQPPSPGAGKAGFEEWLSFLVNASFLASTPSSPFNGVSWKVAPNPSQTELDNFVRHIGNAIIAECSLVLADTNPQATSAAGIAPHLAFLSKLVARDSNLGRVHLFTLNYDTLFEQALELLGIQYFDGFTGRAEARFDPSVYGLDIYYPGEVAEGRVRRFDKFLHLYKLHGSIHWTFRANELRARHPDLQRFVNYGSLNATQKGMKLAALDPNVPVAGILPTANKFTQTLTMPFAHLFRAFQIRLSAPQTFLLVLGYGFGDEHVNQIIETALMNPSLVMLVIEPNPRSPTIARIQRFKELGKRAFVLTSIEAAFDPRTFRVANFDDFARSIMPDVKWLDDFLRLRRYEKQIQRSDDGRNEGAASEI